MSQQAVNLPLLDPPPPPPTPPAEVPLKAKVLCPPPKVDALLQLLRMRHGVFDKDEQARLKGSPMGKRVQETVKLCHRYGVKLLASREKAKKSSDKADKEALKEDSWRYKVCLAISSCPERMQKFQSCWAQQYYSIPPESLETLAEHGEAEQVFNSLCEPERKAVERCVGNLVSRAVRAADTGE